MRAARRLWSVLSGGWRAVVCTLSHGAQPFTEAWDILSSYDRGNRTTLRRRILWRRCLACGRYLIGRAENPEDA